MLLQQIGERCRNACKPMNVLCIIICQTHETLHILDTSRGSPLHNGINFSRVHPTLAPPHKMPKILNPGLPKAALGLFSVQLAIPQPLQNLPEVHFMLLGRTTENQNVIKVNGHKGIEPPLKSAIHQTLEGRRCIAKPKR